MSVTLIANAAAGGGSTSATTGAVDSTGANLAVVPGGRLFSSITWSDSKGNTFTALSTYTHSIFGGSLAYCLNLTVGSGHTFTGSGTQPAVGASLFSGVDAYDQESGSGGGGSSTRQPGSITPPSDGCLFFTGFTADNNNYWAVDSGFTLAGSIDNSPGTHFSVAWAYKIQTTAAAENPTWTEVGSNNNNIAFMATFTPAAGGGGIHAHRKVNSPRLAGKIGGGLVS